MDGFLRRGNFKRFEWIQPIIDQCADLFFDVLDEREFLIEACGAAAFRDIKFTEEDAMRCQAVCAQKRLPRFEPRKSVVDTTTVREKVYRPYWYDKELDAKDVSDVDGTLVFFGDKYMQFFDFCATLDCMASLLDFYERLIAKAKLFGPSVYNTLDKHIPSPRFIPWEFLDRNTHEPLVPLARYCTPFEDQRPSNTLDIDATSTLVAKDAWDKNADNTYMFHFPFYDIYTSLLCGFFIQYHSTSNEEYYGRFVNHCVYDFVAYDLRHDVKSSGVGMAYNTETKTHVVPTNAAHTIYADPEQVWGFRDILILANILMPRSLAYDYKHAKLEDENGYRVDVPTMYAVVQHKLTGGNDVDEKERPNRWSTDYNNFYGPYSHFSPGTFEFVPGVHIALGAPGIAQLHPMGYVTDSLQPKRYNGEVPQNDVNELYDKPLSVDHVKGVLRSVLPGFDHSKIDKFKSRHASLYSMRHCVRLSEALHETEFLEQALKRFYSLVKIYAHQRLTDKSSITGGSSIEAIRRYLYADGVRPTTLPVCSQPNEMLVLRDKSGKPVPFKDAVYKETDADGNVTGVYLDGRVDPYQTSCERAHAVGQSSATADDAPEHIALFNEYMHAYESNFLDIDDTDDHQSLPQLLPRPAMPPQVTQPHIQQPPPSLPPQVYPVASRVPFDDDYSQQLTETKSAFDVAYEPQAQSTRYQPLPPFPSVTPFAPVAPTTPAIASTTRATRTRDYELPEGFIEYDTISLLPKGPSRSQRPSTTGPQPPTSQLAFWPRP